jgi:hypothetical protein
LLHGKLAEMRLPTRSIGNLQHKMQGLNLSIFTHHLKNDRVLATQKTCDRRLILGIEARPKAAVFDPVLLKSVARQMQTGLGTI